MDTLRRMAAFAMATMMTVTSAQGQQQVAKNDPSADTNGRDVMARTVTVTLNKVSVKDAIEALGNTAHIRISYLSKQVNAATTAVTLRVKNMPLKIALERVLVGTGLYAVPVASDVVSIKMAQAGEAIIRGGITGTVIDAHTRQPLRKVVVRLDDDTRGVTTDETGTFRFLNVANGEHRVAVRMLGYVRQAKAITVTDGETAKISFELEIQTNALEQVIVTGTVIPTELKAVPNAITIVTAKQIQERGITRIDQLFRGDIPGLFSQSPSSDAALDQVLMYSRGASTIGFSSVGSAYSTNPIKTYIDGVELSSPQYLTQIDPKSIERIEILTGPQASTIYGSNAINGVMQIFTKRGTTSKPQISLSLLSGVVQNNFSSSLTPQHDYSGQLSAVEGRISYNMGGSWTYVGPWTPAKKTTRVNVFGGARITWPTPVGQVTGDFMARRGRTRNLKYGSEFQGITGAQQSGLWYPNNTMGLDVPRGLFLGTTTYGATVGYAPTSWWSHELQIGDDATNIEERQLAASHISLGDTTLSYATNSFDRRSLRYSTTARIPVSSFVQATVTLGADSWQSLSNTIGGFTPLSSLSGFLGFGYGVRQPGHNTGGFAQLLFGVKEKLFFTYGIRGEWNPDFGKDAIPTYAPRYGIAYTTDVGPVSAKLRASYGRSTRPPGIDQKLALKAPSDDPIVPGYGLIDTRIANPLLGPETQQGGEGGIDLYFGSRAWLSVTRYNQTVNDLITTVPGVDSVRSLAPNPLFFGFLTCAQAIRSQILTWCSSQDAEGYGYALQTQNVNATSLRNQGWELQGSFTTGPVTARGTYSWTKSRVIGLTEKYRKYFTPEKYPDYQPGATFQFIPEHTWAFGLTYAHAATTVAMSLAGVGPAGNRDSEFFLTHIDGGIRLAENRWNVSDRPYFNFNPAYVTSDLTASHRLSSAFEAVLEVQNLTNHYTQDFSSRLAVIGRQGRAGFRIRL